MKSFKRLVGLLLCLAMVLSFVPASIVSAAESGGTTTQNAVEPTDILEKIDISGTVVGTCSSPYNSDVSYANQNWYSTQEPGWKTLNNFVDGSLSNEITYKVSAGERGDVYLDLTKKDGSAISADQFKLYYGASGSNTTMPAVTVVLELANGSEVEETFTTNWSGNAAQDPVEWTFGQTYEIEGIYIYSSTPGGEEKQVSFGEIELYQYVELPYLETANLNGVDLGQYKIVYSDTEPDYTYTAAQYIQKQILLRTGRNLTIIEDNTAETAYEIVVGQTNRGISNTISAPANHQMKFTITSEGTKVAMEADYFIIAGAAYYFVDAYIGTADFENTVPSGARELTPITEKANNYIFLIGDGMGEMHTRLFEIYDVPTSGNYAYSDGEDIFYGYYLPYFGWQKTANLTGAITDSAAAGTALSTGYKTTNGYVGKDQYLNDVKNMSELAMEIGKSVAVMSTEGADGATPAAYSAHSSGRYDNDVIVSQKTFTANGGLLVDNYNNYNTFTAAEWNTWEPLVKAGLNSVASDPDGFFIMYEEAHIDKVSHRLKYTSEAGYTGDTSRETLFQTVYRFNQAIGLFMEYAMYNPDTMILITADHETAGLDANFEPTEQNPVNEQQGGSVWNHSLKDVPVFSYGQGAEIFNGVTAENASYARTWAHLMTDGNANNFGNAAYPIIGSGESGEVDEGQNFYTDIPTDATKVDVSAPTFGYYEGDKNGDITPYYDPDGKGYTPDKLIDGTNDDKNNRVDSGYYTYEELADGTKVPVILFDFGEDVNVAGIKLTGYEFGRYNIEDFDIEVYAHDGYSTSWYTAATVRDAFTVGTNGEQITTPLEIGFNQIRTATAMRIVVKGITNMSAEAADDADSAELATGSYFRIKEIEVYETEAPTVTPQPTEPTTEPTEAPTQAPTEAPTQAPTAPAGPLVPATGTYLELIPESSLTPYVGDYIDGDFTNLVNQDAGEAAYLTDASLKGAGYIGTSGSAANKVQAAVIEVGGTKMIGGVELVARTNDYLKTFDIQVKKTDGTWVSVQNVTEDPFVDVRSVKYTWTPVEGTAIRVLCYSWVDKTSGSDYPMLTEITVFEAKTGSILQEVVPSGVSCPSTVFTPGADIENTIDGVRGNYVPDYFMTNGLPAVITFDMTQDGAPSNVKRMILYAMNDTQYAPNGIKLEVQTEEDGDFAEIYNGDAYVANFTDTFVLDFDQAYDVYAIRLTVSDVLAAQLILTEVDFYGYQMVAGSTDPTDPILPSVVMKPVTNVDAPTVGFYTDNDTDGAITEWLNEDTNKGKVPAVLVDGETGEDAPYNWTGYYRYDDVASGAKIPVYLFEFDDPVAFTGVQIDTYKAMYYCMEDFTVQVYTTDGKWVTATTVADSFGSKLQEEYAEPETYAFAEPLYGTKIRILVDKIWNMYDWRYDDEYSFNLEYEASIRLREITLMEDPDYVPPVDEANTLTPPASLTATYISADAITVVAPPSTEYPEAEIRYAAYLNGELVAVNTTGVFTGLTPNTSYTFYAKYIGDGETWQDSHSINNTTATDKLKLPAPTNVQATLGTNSITATADPVEGGTLMFRLMDENHIAIQGMGWSTNNQFTGLTAGTQYTIQVKYNGDTDHYDSEITELTVVTGHILLPKPTLTVSGTTSDTITLNALAAVDGGSAEYAYSIDGTNWTTTTNTVITGLNPNTTYYLKARYVATDSTHDSSLYSEVVTATTKMAPLPLPNLTVTGTTDSSITATAEPNANGTLMFRINGGEWQESGEFTGLNRNTNYTVEAMYVGKSGYFDSDVATITATTLKTQLNNPTGLTVTNTTTNSITVTADPITGGTLMFSIDGGNNWQTEKTFTGLTHGTDYTVWAMYVAEDGYINSGVTTTSAKTVTILDAPELTVTTTDTTITVTAPSVAGGTLQYRINGGAWQTSGTFTGLKSNTSYTVEAMYVASSSAYADSAISTKTVATEKGVAGTNGDYAYLEAIPESGVTAHVGYNRYSNHEMLSENLEQSALISDAMFGTISKIMGAEAVPADKLADGYRLLSIVYDLNNGTTKVGAIELTGGDYNLTKFSIQVKNTKGVWQTVKFVTNDLFDISEALRNDTVLIPFTPVEGTKVRLLINGYEANANNTPEIREMVIYEVKEDALLTQVTADSSTVDSIDAPKVIDGNKATVYTGNSVVLNFDEPTNVKRLKLFGDTVGSSIGEFTVEVQTEKDGNWKQVYSGTGYTGASAYNTYIASFDSNYDVYAVRVNAASAITIPEIEVYGYFEAPEYKDPTPPTTPGATAPAEATRPPVVSPVQTNPAATEKFEVPNEPDWAETTPSVPNENAWNEPQVNVPGETGTEPTAPVATQPVATQPQGWLDVIPQSQITPHVGYYTESDKNTLTDEYPSEAAYLNDAYFATGAYVRGENSSTSGKIPAAVMDLGGTKTIGGLLLVGKASEHITTFDIEYYSPATGKWELGVSVTSDPFTENSTQTFLFAQPVECTQVRVLVKTFKGSNPLLQELNVLELKTGNALVQIPLENPAVNKNPNDSGCDNEYIADGDLYTFYDVHPNQLPAEFTASLATGEGIPTTVSRVKVFTYYGPSNGAPNKIKIELKVGGNWTEVYNGVAYAADAKDTFVCDLSEEYAATDIRLTVSSRNGTNAASIADIQVFGPGEGSVSGGGSGSYTPSAPDYVKVPLNKDNLYGGCSTQNAGTNYIDNGQFASTSYWYFNSSKGNLNRLYGLVDGTPGGGSNNLATYSQWGNSSHERSDFYLTFAAPTAISQIKLYSYKYSSYINPTSFKVVFVNGTTVVGSETFETGWSSSAATGTECSYNFTQTYTVTGLYVWANESESNIALSEVELYVKEDVQLPAPGGLTATTVTEDSITVTANAITTGGTLKYRINAGEWTTNPTFTGLTAGTSYTIDAMYVAADGYIDSGVSTITVTTAVPVVTEFTVSGTVTAGATVQLYKDGAAKYTATVDGTSYSFSNVAIGNYTLVVTKAGHTTQMEQITVDKNVEKNVTLVSSYTVSGTVSGSTTDSVTVKLYQSGMVKYTATVTPDGNNAGYEFTSVAIGNYKLVITKHGHTTKIEDITVSTGNVTKNVTLEYVTYTVSGTVNAGATVQLMQNGAVVDEVVAADGSYSFDGVDLGNYVLVVTKPDHISNALSITVNKNLEGQNITLNPVPIESTKVDPNPAVALAQYNVRLYEPWALRVNVSFYEESGNFDSAIDLSNFKSYGAYAIIANKYGDGETEPTSWEQIISDPDAVQFRMAAGEGDGNMFAVNDTTVVFDYYDGLYTYRLAEHVYWVAYYEDMDGTIHFTEVRKPKLMDKVDNVLENIADDVNQETQRIVLEHMKQLHYALKDFRGEDAEFGNVYEQGVLNYNQNLGENYTGGDKYQFGKSHRIRLIEPWGIKINMLVRKNGATYDFADAQDYGLIFFHDKKGEYNGKMSAKQMLARNDVYIYSKSRNNASLEAWNTNGYLGITAVYDNDIFTYEMDSELYYLPFVVDADGNYHYSTNANCMNLIDEMYNYYNRTNLKNEERLTFKAMIQLHESTMIHRKKYGK